MLIRRIVPILAAACLFGALGAGSAAAAVSCPSANPVLNENNCMGAGTTSWQLADGSDTGNVAGFTPQSSYNIGTSVPLKIARNQPTFPSTTVDVAVYRMGFYAGLGARLIPAAGHTAVAVNNAFSGCGAIDATTGKLSCAGWAVTYTIPGSSLPASGVYVAKITTTDTHEQNWIQFTVRDDARTSQLLVVEPSNTWQAYNTWGNKSLYFDKNGGDNTIAGSGRAVKVSLDRPMDTPEGGRDRFFNGPDLQWISWLELQGYDVTYTDDGAVSTAPNSLLTHKAVMVSGHSEYWSAEEYNAFTAARDAGINLASFSANTTYWKIRYEDSGRTIVSYKTVQGIGSGQSATITPNDPGPDGIAGTADDALGADGIAGTADDKPANATTTWRDNGAPAGDPNAPAGGRVGPNRPENSLWGVMYVGDNDSVNYPLVAPATNASGEYSGDRLFRNTGAPTNIATTVSDGEVGWEWDAIPTQAQYLAQQPSGVKRILTSPTSTQGSVWLQDEGHSYSNTPPPGQPGASDAVKYKAASGALVFASGTMYWPRFLGSPMLDQLTYNILSDMSVKPATPDDVTVDAAGSNTPPTASLTVTPNPAKPNTSVAFNASASTDVGGSITDYQWDFDGDGVYETDTHTSSSTTHVYTAEATYNVRVKVTDNGGATDFTVRSLTILGNQPPVAALTATPNPAVIGQAVAFSGAGSTDADGTVTDYQWDLDGNGTYESDTGTTKTTSKTYATAGTYNVSLKATDNGGKSSVMTVPVTVNSGGVSNYGDEVLATAGLQDYWRLGETSGTVLADSKGTHPATASSVTLGVGGGPAGDPNTAARFNGSTSCASVPLDLSGTQKVTLEFWMKWNSFASDDRLAAEFTSNFNDNDGGFLIDPNAPQNGGMFGVAIGRFGTRNSVYFARPSAGAWHHYAIVMDGSAAASSEIKPYVDGAAVAVTQGETGTGTTFASSTLYMMSRACSGLQGDGDLDEVALYNKALDATTIAGHAGSYGTNKRPVASFTSSPASIQPGTVVTYNATGSSDPDGTITNYKWDLDGNGSYETDTGATKTVTKTYSSEQELDIGLKVTDNLFAAQTTTRHISVGNRAPTAAFTATPNPAVVGQSVAFNGSTSSDPDGTIAKYEWDLDGNGTYETNTTTTATTTKTFAATGTVNVGLRVTDNGGKTATATVPVTVNSGGVSSYGDAVASTSGLADYWRMGETAGPTLADSAGSKLATVTGGTFGVPGGPAADPNTAITFNGTSDSARADLDLTSASAITVEFWLKWVSYSNNDALAMEFTTNFNSTAGGFLIDPNADGGKFGIGYGAGSTRNNAYFTRPSAGAWHHYAIVIDPTTTAANEITPYVDGAAIAYTKSASGTGGGFASSTLYMMSRAGNALFGSGTLDELAVYKRALTSSEVVDHFGSFGTNRKPVASFTATPSTVGVGASVAFTGAASSDPDGTIAKYEWDFEGDGTYDSTATTPTASRSYAATGTYTARLRVTDNTGTTATTTRTVTVTSAAPHAAFTISPSPSAIGSPTTFDAATSTDPGATITNYKWDLDGDGIYETDGGTAKTTTKTFSAAGTVDVGLRITDSVGATDTVVHTVTVKGATYSSTVLGTTGLSDYWRMGEASGTTLVDTVGGRNATLSGGLLGVTGAIAGDSAVRFGGSVDFASAPVDLSSTSQLSVEFWLKWNAFANDDRLAFELTPNFNSNDGGLLIDPDAGSSFGIGIGRGGSRNTAYFARPSAGVWHHYAIVIDTAQPAATQITPYVDGQPVAFFKDASGTGAGTFANSTLYFMSRGGASLFGAGDLDEVAIYKSALSASTIATHVAAGAP
jgi:YD repeat-containing protein